MKLPGQLAALAVGVGLGVVGASYYLAPPTPAAAGSNDRTNDYVTSTGAVALNPKQQADGVWLLDYKAGKLLGTVIDKTQGKIVGWVSRCPNSSSRVRKPSRCSVPSFFMLEEPAAFSSA